MTSHVADQFPVLVAASRSRFNDAALYSHKHHIQRMQVQRHPQICITILQMPYLVFTPYHVATDKVPSRNGDKFRSIFSDNLQPIATRGKKARGTLLSTTVALSAHPSPLVITTKLAAAILGWPLFGRGLLPAQYNPCGFNCHLTNLHFTILIRTF